MVVLRLKSFGFCLTLPSKLFSLKFKRRGVANTRNFSVVPFRKTCSFRLLISGITIKCKNIETSSCHMNPGCLTQIAVTNEICFYRDTRNNFTQMCFTDTKEPYGPPLAILLPWKGLGPNWLKKFVELYGEKGFDVITVNLTTEQYLYPCMAGNAMSVVTELLEYLNSTHKYRPYIFHGFSIGVYIYGEILAQFSDYYELYQTLANNVKGCLWDSPVDILSVKALVGKALFPKTFLSRLRCNRAVKHHFREHYYDSVVYWLRSRENFCNPMIKVPNVFFMSYADLLSNPCTLKSVYKMLECSGVPTFQKTWYDSQHSHHFEKYCYEYMYGMVLFLNLASLFPDQCGKYRCSQSNSVTTNLRLNKTTKD